VEIHASIYGKMRPPRELHYGDPPRHGCVGDTMNCDDLEVLEVWHRPAFGDFERHPELEGVIDGDG